jgi:hypothetical protein
VRFHLKWIYLKKLEVRKLDNKQIFVQSILKGKIINNPQYINQEVNEYKGNPCIEALPPIFLDKYVVENLAEYFIPTDNEKMQSANIRYHFLKRIKSYYQPLTNQLRIEHILSSLIRRSYISRNPSSKEYLMRMRLILETIEEQENDKLQSNHEVCKKISSKLSIIPETSRSTAECSSIIGISGMGKSICIEKLLLMYPQVIIHHKYNGKPLTRTQIAWIKIDCPFDGSLKTLCKMFFKALDDILLTTNYFDKFGYNRNSTATMMIHMAHLASLYSVGVLVIDEMQHLINPKNSPYDIMNFLVTLVNTIGISIIQIGTPKVIDVINLALREIRRAEETGCIIWDRMKEDDEWDFFITNLWECQWLKKFIPLDEELKHEMYFNTQGITSIVIGLFVLVQTHAIFNATEKITLKSIKYVMKNDLRLTNNVISAIRSGKESEMCNYEDIKIEIENSIQGKIADSEYRKSVQELSQQNKESIVNKNNNFKKQITSEIVLMGLFTKLDYANIYKIVEEVMKKQFSLDNISKVKQNIIKTAMVEEERITKEKEQIKSIKKKEIFEKKDLRYLFSMSIKDKVHIYDLLKSNNYIKDPLEEFYK